MLVPMQIPTHFHKNQEVFGMPLKTYKEATFT